MKSLLLSLLFVILLLSVAPTLIASSPLIPWIVRQTALLEQGYEIQIGATSLSWRGPQQIKNLEISCTQTGERIHIASLTLDQNLFSLALHPTRSLDAEFVIDAWEKDGASLSEVSGKIHISPTDFPTLTIKGSSLNQREKGAFSLRYESGLLKGNVTQFPTQFLVRWIPKSIRSGLGETISFQSAPEKQNPNQVHVSFSSGDLRFEGQLEQRPPSQLQIALSSIPGAVVAKLTTLKVPPASQFTLEGTLDRSNPIHSVFHLTSEKVQWREIRQRNNSSFEIGEFVAFGAKPLHSLVFTRDRNRIAVQGHGIDFSHSSNQTRLCLKKFPSAYLQLFPLHLSALAFIGPELDLNYEQTPSKLTCTANGSNGHLHLSGHIRDQTILLSAPAEIHLKKFSPHFSPHFSRLQLAEGPLQLRVSPDGAEIPINLAPQNFKIRSATLLLPQMTFKTGSELKKYLPKAEKIHVWATPLFFSCKNGKVRLKRFDFLLQNRHPFAVWGNVEFPSERLHLSLGVSGSALDAIFGVAGVPKRTMVAVPIDGKLKSPKVRLNKLATLAASLIAKQTGTAEGVLLGTVLGLAHNQIQKEKIPPPTTKPLPWE